MMGWIVAFWGGVIMLIVFSDFGRKMYWMNVRSRMHSGMARQQKRTFFLYLEIYACIIGTKSTIQSFLLRLGSCLLDCEGWDWDSFW